MNVIGIIQAVHPEDLVMIFMKTIILHFVGDIDQDKQKTGDANGQTHDIQYRIVEMLQDIPDGNGYKMSEHGSNYIEYGEITATNVLPYFL